MTNEELLTLIRTDTVTEVVHTEYGCYRIGNRDVGIDSHLFTAGTIEHAEQIALETRLWILHTCRRATRPILVYNWLPVVQKADSCYVVDYKLIISDQP